MGRVLRLALLLLSARAEWAAIAERIAASHSRDAWDVAAGFPGGYVYAITQTRDGYLWIAGSKGLIRYDGTRFALIRESPVLGAARDSTGQLWAIDDVTHLFRFAGGRLVGPVPDQGQHRHRAAVIGVTARGTLLYASELQGVIEYGPGAPQVLLDPGATPDWLTAVAQTADGVYWIGTRDTGLYSLNARSGGPGLERITGAPFDKINSLLPLGPSTLLIGTNHGLLSLHQRKWIRQTRAELKDQPISTLLSGMDGEVWIGAEGHVFKADPKDISGDGAIQSLEQLPVRAAVTALFEDRDRNLWIGGPEILERYRGDGFNTYASSAGLPSNNCGAIYVDEQGDTWFAPWDGGLFRLSKGQMEQITIAGLKDDTVYSISGAAGEIWVARKYGGVTRLRRRGNVLEDLTYTRREGLAQDSVYSIYSAPDGAVWAGTLNQGLCRLRAGKWQTFTTQDGMPSNRISAITGNPAGEIFAGTPNGLAVLKKNGWASYTAREGLPPGGIESLSFDPRGTLWIGTAKGISFLQSGTMHVPAGAPDPLYEEILGMAQSGEWLWIATANHVLRVTRAALLKDAFEAGDYREFGVAEGLPSVEGVKRSRSVVEDNRGRIWFSLNRGISVLQPSAFSGSSFPVTVRLDGVLIDGKLAAAEDQIRIPSGRHRLTFQYTGVNVSNPESIRYRYQLDKVDAGWSRAAASREVEYTNVPPGHFRFHVVARNPEGLWNGQEAGLSMDVDPAFWQDRTNQFLAFLTVAALAWFAHRLRLRQMTDRVELRHTERLAERSRIARDLHDTLLQSFQGVLMKFYGVSYLLPGRPAEAREMLDTVIEEARQAVTEGRDAVQGLRSSTVVANDLAQAISTLGEGLAADSARPNTPQFSLEVEGRSRNLPPILRDEVYRIAFEAMRNAFRHAEATRIVVEIHYGDRQLRLRVRDDGKGIDPAILGAGRAGHHGLAGMKERAELVGGRLAVFSRPNSGTEVELTVPASVAYTKAAKA